MNLIWLVKCDECGKLINAKEDVFNIDWEGVHRCDACMLQENDIKELDSNIVICSKCSNEINIESDEFYVDGFDSEIFCRACR